MMSKSHDPGSRHGVPWRIVGWSIPALLLLLPLVSGAPWTLSDFVTAGAMFIAAGLGIELALHSSRDLSYRAGAGAAVAATFLLVWVNIGVGFLGNEDNPANLIFGAVLAVALIGAFLAHFRAAGMARAMYTTAACQVVVGVVALAAGWAAPGRAGIYEVVMGTSLFAGLWLASGWLFARSARRQAVAASE